jgi:predicted RNA-binding protein YlxR (DUF448 family)
MKKEILRKCIVSNEVLPRDNLFRVVLDNSGSVKIDYSYRLNGHGVYLKKDKDIILKAMKTKALDRYLSTKVDEEIYKELLEHL